MSIAPNAVKELREKTSAGMMDCKKALEQARGDMEQAVEILRKKGLSVAQQKAGRTASEGILGCHDDKNGRLACLVEVNCETDFVVKTEDFQNFVKEAIEFVRLKNPKDVETLRSNLQAQLTALVAKIGENMQVKRFVRWEVTSPKEKIGTYLHAGSKIGVLVSLVDTSATLDPETAKEIAMHVAAMNPKFIRPEEIPVDVVEKEREIQKAGVDTSKPVEIQNKIVEGKLKRFFSEVCLEEQIFVRDPEGKRTVKEWLKAKSPSAKIEKFVRLQVGT